MILIGQRTGHLVVELRLGPRRFRLRCDCGGSVDLIESVIVRGQLTCGMRCPLHTEQLRERGGAVAQRRRFPFIGRARRPGERTP